MASNVNMEKLRTPRAAGRRRGAAARRVGAFAADQRAARVVQQAFSTSLLARAVELLSQSVEPRVHVHLLYDRHVRRALRSVLQRWRRG